MGAVLAPQQVLRGLGVDGVLVLEVPAGSPAAAAGLRATYRDVFGDLVLGDIIGGLGGGVGGWGMGSSACESCLLDPLQIAVYNALANLEPILPLPKKPLQSASTRAPSAPRRS
jgi:hypothetical protein